MMVPDVVASGKAFTAEESVSGSQVEPRRGEERKASR